MPSFSCLSCSISVTVSNPIKSGLLSCTHKVLLCLSPELTLQKADTLISEVFQTPHYFFYGWWGWTTVRPQWCPRLWVPDWHSLPQLVLKHSRASLLKGLFFSRLPVLFAGGPHCCLQRLNAITASPLCEQLVSCAAAREPRGEGARGVSCRQPKRHPWAATFSAHTQGSCVAATSITQILSALCSTGWQPQIWVFCTELRHRKTP